MSTKFISFLAMVWFLSTLICLIMEGSYFGQSHASIIKDLSIFTTVPIIGTFSVPVININFFTMGMPKLLLWDYSFYTGGWQIIRWFWVVTLSPGAVWGIIQAFIWLYGQATSLFRLIPGV